MPGGDMTHMDPFTLALLTNPEILAINSATFGNREVRLTVASIFHSSVVVNSSIRSPFLYCLDFYD